ncbi:MAG: hypothetical protein RQ798_01370 [Candidatus Caldarchaeales archaeon]|nr:hypothetical protein [Candidatus Caldarchaeales archaeon]
MPAPENSLSPHFTGGKAALQDIESPPLEKAEYVGSVKIKSRVFVFFRNLDATPQHLNQLSPSST